MFWSKDMNVLQISYLKLADHKNGKRVWMQGLKLEEAGYKIGSLYSRHYDKEKHQVVLLTSDNEESEDTRKVCRKKVGDEFYPLIDIVNQKLAELFSDVERIQVTIQPGKITIEYHLHDWMRIEREYRLKQTLLSGLAVPIASMAHGAGIMDYYLHKGLEESGVRSGMIWAVEPDNTYLQTSLNNNPIWSYQSQVIEGRIEDVDAKSLQSPLMIFSGLPCTGASKSGRVKNKLAFAEAHESAGTAFIGWLMAIKELSPAILILENVPEYQCTVSMHMIRETLTDWRYKLHEVIVGRELGAFEDRKRLCLICVSEGLDFELDLQPVRQREKTLGEILDNVPLDSKNWKACDYLDKKAVRDKQAGKGFSMQLVDGESSKVGCIGRGYARIRSTEPLVKHPTSPALKRLLTANEVSKVKTIDKTLVKGMSRSKQLEMMGQSVLGVAFQAVGRNLGECLTRQFLSNEIEAA
jgi:DNA (cytosine-5)-methyltransferase 1